MRKVFSFHRYTIIIEKKKRDGNAIKEVNEISEERWTYF